MISECPHCHKALQFNEVQREKLERALAGLKSESLKLGCPHCKDTIRIRRDGSLVPDDGVKKQGPTPPAYPDISWLASGIYEEQEVVEDVPKALIMVKEGEIRDAVARAVEGEGYQLVFPESAADALEQMRFVNFAAVVLQDGFDGSIKESVLHRHMAGLPMSIRRAAFYALIGDFHTLYNLEALAFSANVVVNEHEASHFDVIFKKGMRESDELFGPYRSSLAAVR